MSGKYPVHQSSVCRTLFFRVDRNTDEGVPSSKSFLTLCIRGLWGIFVRAYVLGKSLVKQALFYITLCGGIDLVLQRVSLTDFWLIRYLPNQPILCKTNSLSSGVDEVRPDCAYELSLVWRKTASHPTLEYAFGKLPIKNRPSVTSRFVRSSGKYRVKENSTSGEDAPRRSCSYEQFRLGNCPTPCIRYLRGIFNRAFALGTHYVKPALCHIVLCGKVSCKYRVNPNSACRSL